jgi:hypothetical protein
MPLLLIANAATVDVQVTATVESSAQLSVSDTAIDFGVVSPDVVRYATTTGGSFAEVPAHTVTVSSSDAYGFTLTLEGQPPQVGGEVIDEIGPTPITLQPGSETFGIRLAAASGPGSVAAPFNGTGYAYSSGIQTIYSSAGPLAETVYDAFYGAAVSTSTVPASYQTDNYYTLVSSF